MASHVFLFLSLCSWLCSFFLNRGKHAQHGIDSLIGDVRPSRSSYSQRAINQVSLAWARAAIQSRSNAIYRSDATATIATSATSATTATTMIIEVLALTLAYLDWIHIYLDIDYS